MTPLEKVELNSLLHQNFLAARMIRMMLCAGCTLVCRAASSLGFDESPRQNFYLSNGFANIKLSETSLR